jgi:hypothetical protein
VFAVVAELEVLALYSIKRKYKYVSILNIIAYKPTAFSLIATV